jgi:rare lipoprotein A
MTRSITVASALMFCAALAGTAQAQGQAAPAAPPVPAAVLESAAPAPAPAAEPTKPTPGADAEGGKIAYYGKKFAGRKTASGERFNPNAMTMAHKTLPFGTLVRVTNPANKRSVVVRVNDRGPTTPDRVGDVSLAAAQKLGMLKGGVIDANLAVTGTAKAAKKRA